MPFSLWMLPPCSCLGVMSWYCQESSEICPPQTEVKMSTNGNQILGHKNQMVYFTDSYVFGLWLSFLELAGSKLREFVGWPFSFFV